MKVIPIRSSRARTAAPSLFGPPASSAFTPSDSTHHPSAASSAARKSATNAPSGEILRARDLLRDLLLREDEANEEESVALVGHVYEGLDEICSHLDSLAGLQMMFEAWSG
jgi:hypothetical protein